MVSMDRLQTGTLKRLEEAAYQRYELRRAENRMLQDYREEIEEEVWGEYYKEMDELITMCKELGVPLKRIGEAWGTSDHSTIKRLVEKHWKPGPTPDTPHQAKNEIDGIEEN